MGGFFHGWRRKLGVVTLLMALVFAGGWVRSLIVGDIVRFPVREATGQFASNGGIIYVESLSPNATKLHWDTRQADPPSEPDFFSEGEEYEWLWDGGEFLCYKGRYRNSDVCFWCVAAPYWSITVPLTLISLWLLLTKPRKSTQKKTAEPDLSEGT